MSNIHHLKNSTATISQIGHNNPPKTPDEWGKYVAEATAMERDADKAKVAAIIEKGKRIAQFHDAYKAEGQKWGKRWDDVCQKTLGLGEAICRQYVLASENIRSTDTDILPPDLTSLYYLARAIRANREAFDDAVTSGAVNTDMSRDEAKAVADRAETAGGSDEARMMQLAQAGHNHAEIARQLGMTKATGGTRTDHQARSLVNKKLKKLGVHYKPSPAAPIGSAPVLAKPRLPVLSLPRSTPVVSVTGAPPSAAPTPLPAPAPSQAQQTPVVDQAVEIAALRKKRNELTSEVTRLNALLTSAAAKPRKSKSKLDKEIEFLRLGMEVITAEDQSIILDLGLLVQRTFMVMPAPMPIDMYQRNMKRQIGANPRFIPELTKGYKP
jgi:hypothetical protein